MEKFILHQNKNYSHRLIFNNGGEVPGASMENSDKLPDAKKEIENLTPEQATDLLKDPKKLQGLMKRLRVGPGEFQKDYPAPSRLTKALVNKIRTDQGKLAVVADERLKPENRQYVNELAFEDGDTLEQVMEAMNQPDGYFMKIYEDKNIKNNGVKIVALSKINDMQYKMGKIKPALAELSTNTKVKEEPVGVKRLDVSDQYHIALISIRSIKDQNALFELRKIAMNIKTQSPYAEEEKKFLIDTIEDQMKV